MPANRIGFSSDFVLTSSQVGIGTTNPQATVDVVGTVIGDFVLSGDTTFNGTYAGFTPQEQNISFDTIVGIKTVGVGTFTQPYETETGNLELVGQFNTVSEDIIVDEGKIFEITEDVVIGITTLGTQDVYVPDDSVVSVGTLESVSIQSHFSVPDGGITERVDNPIEGSVRFNDDLNTLEFYNGVEWRQFTVTGASGRGVFGAGSAATYGSSIEYINISSTGNSQYFGELRTSVYAPGAFASSTRGIFCGGAKETPFTIQATIDYLTIASAGNSISFGSLTTGYVHTTGLSSSTRGIIGGSYLTVNTIEYVTISQLGNSLDFGDLSLGRCVLSSLASPTRGIFTGGGNAPSTVSLIDFITIASTGNATFFGDLTEKREAPVSCSNSTRGITFGGFSSAGYLNSIEQLTISSFGSSVDFGDLNNYTSIQQSCSTQIRGICAGGFKGPSTFYNSIDYITIATAGNAQDFGDLIINRSYGHGLSDSHGGLGGF